MGKILLDIDTEALIDILLLIFIIEQHLTFFWDACHLQLQLICFIGVALFLFFMQRIVSAPRIVDLDEFDEADLLRWDFGIYKDLEIDVLTSILVPMNLL